MTVRDLTWDERVDALMVALKVADVRSESDQSLAESLAKLRDGSLARAKFCGTTLDLGPKGSTMRILVLRYHLDRYRIPHTIEEQDDGEADVG